MDTIKPDWGNFNSNLIFLEKTKVLSEDKNILEIGSGTGHLIRHLKDQNYNIVGTEADDKFIQYAKENYNVELIREKTSKLNFDDNYFDLVISFDVFEHIPDIKNHIQEVKRVLKNNGIYALSTPNKWTNIPYEIISHRSLTKYKEYHCSLQNYWQLRKLFEKNGFEVNYIDVPIVNDFFLAKIRKNFGKPGLMLAKMIPMDKMHYSMRTNFYIVAKLIR